MITETNESKRYIEKHISWKYECKFDGRKCKSNQKWNNNECWCECKSPKEHLVREKIIVGTLPHLATKMVTIVTKHYRRFSNYIWWNYRHDKNSLNKNRFNRKCFNKSCSNKLLYFTVLITIPLLIAVSILLLLDRI